MAAPNLPDDSYLLELLRKDGEAAIELLFRAYYTPLCRTALRIVSDAHAAEDLVQEVFFELWRKRDSLMVTTSVQAYLHRATRNKALNFLRDKKGSWEEEPENVQLASLLPGAEQRLEAEELQQLIARAIEALPDRCRAVFVLSRHEEMSYQQIADALGISVKTVENQIAKALKILRSLTESYFPGGGLLLFFWWWV